MSATEFTKDMDVEKFTEEQEKRAYQVWAVVHKQGQTHPMYSTMQSIVSKLKNKNKNKGMSNKEIEKKEQKAIEGVVSTQSQKTIDEVITKFINEPTYQEKTPPAQPSKTSTLPQPRKDAVPVILTQEIIKRLTRKEALNWYNEIKQGRMRISKGYIGDMDDLYNQGEGVPLKPRGQVVETNYSIAKSTTTTTSTASQQSQPSGGKTPPYWNINIPNKDFILGDFDKDDTRNIDDSYPFDKDRRDLADSSGKKLSTVIIGANKRNEIDIEKAKNLVQHLKKTLKKELKDIKISEKALEDHIKSPTAMTPFHQINQAWTESQPSRKVAYFLSKINNEKIVASDEIKKTKNKKKIQELKRHISALNSQRNNIINREKARIQQQQPIAYKTRYVASTSAEAQRIAKALQKNYQKLRTVNGKTRSDSYINYYNNKNASKAKQGYKGIHMNLVDPKTNLPFHIQIETRRMKRIFGIENEIRRENARQKDKSKKVPINKGNFAKLVDLVEKADKGNRKSQATFSKLSKDHILAILTTKAPIKTFKHTQIISSKRVMRK